MAGGLGGGGLSHWNIYIKWMNRWIIVDLCWSFPPNPWSYSWKKNTCWYADAWWGDIAYYDIQMNLFCFLDSCSEQVFYAMVNFQSREWPHFPFFIMQTRIIHGQITCSNSPKSLKNLENQSIFHNPANNTTVMSKCCMYKLIMMYTTTLSTDDQMMPGPAPEKPKSSNLQATIPL